VSWAGVITFFSDAHTVLVFIGGTLGLAMQIAIFRKQIATKKGVARNEVALHSLHRVVDEDIRHELVVLKKQQGDIQRTTAHLEDLIERRTVQTEHHPSRRAADRATTSEPRRAPIRVVEPIHDPKAGTWPIGGQDFAG
jgi:hypothetical protein